MVPPGSVEVVIDATPFATLALPIPLNVTVPVTDAGLIVAPSTKDQKARIAGQEEAIERIKAALDARVLRAAE